jgi:hypothetical protein
MDVVYYVYQEVALKGYDGLPVHFIMIDEIQDLTNATTLLLLKICEQGVFFSGDTAQTIAKGVTLRFQDISKLFNEVKTSHEEPTI